MKFQVALPGNNRLPGTADWILQLQAPDYQDLAAAVDDLGFDILSTSEHIVMPDWEVPRLGPYWTHALTVMAFIAGATRRIRVDATVLVMPYHHPVELAKAMATLDVLSGGRVNVSVGVGHAEVMKLCWAEPMPVFHGEFFDIEGVAFEPHPLQQPRPPICIGGNSQAALRRAARHDGWQPNPVTMTAAEVPAALDYIRSQPEFAGKEDSFDVHFLVGWMGDGFPRFGDGQLDSMKGQLVDAIGTLAGYGVTTMSVPALGAASQREYVDSLRWFIEDVAPAFRS
jgi:alkanesulfonate monooxygenase SsuD/methylene tetrahydromethanopterin reductase-like flavin-dependent oxidoreductase (luciferase family)